MFSIAGRYSYPVQPVDEARLSPFGHEHINMLGAFAAGMVVGLATRDRDSAPFRTKLDAGMFRLSDTILFRRDRYPI